MRKWYKFEAVSKARADSAHADDFTRFAAQMNGYRADESYQSRDAFFTRYLHQESFGRLMVYDAFLRKHLAVNMRILSIASGRAANELALMNDGLTIICSDLDLPDCIPATHKLFGDFAYEKLDILDNVEGAEYDAVMALSLIYNFDDAELGRFFFNVANLLKPEGTLVLDYVGAPDTLLSRFYHDVYLRVEAWAYAVFRTLKDRRVYTVTKTFHGYRRTNDEIENMALKVGLALQDYAEGGQLLDFQRGYVLPKLMRLGFVRGLLTQIGQRMPYVRLGLFRLKR